MLVMFFIVSSTTAIYTLSLHDALPISPCKKGASIGGIVRATAGLGDLSPHPERAILFRNGGRASRSAQDRKSTRLNSSHSQISYAVFCLKKKKNTSTSPVSYKISDYLA